MIVIWLLVWWLSGTPDVDAYFGAEPDDIMAGDRWNGWGVALVIALILL